MHQQLLQDQDTALAASVQTLRGWRMILVPLLIQSPGLMPIFPTLSYATVQKIPIFNIQLMQRAL